MSGISGEETAAEPAGCSGGILVLKFGGSALATPARVRRAAKRIRSHVRRGSRVVAVVSATGQSTDRILQWCRELSSSAAGARELERALATGEDRTAALVAAALIEIGVPAISLRGAEAGLVAEGDWGEASIRRLRAERLQTLLADDVVPVVAGFQASRPDGETVTLGRGGSDTTATYLAGALRAEACHLITDVDGVYDRDPRLDPSARHLPTLSYTALVELAEAGAQVVHPAAADHARRFGTPLHVYSYRAARVPERGSRIGPNGVRASRPQEPGAPEPGGRTVRIALAGCGVVGGELARLVESVYSAPEHADGVRLEIVRVLVREPGKARPVSLPADRFTSDVSEFLSAPADVVVEAIGGLEPAGTIVRAALDRGTPVVTANKALVGAMGAELASLAAARRTTLDFEAAVGGGIPAVRVLRDALGTWPVRRIRAILNGTTNYVLTLLERGVSFPDAVADAQRAGFAEADPGRDLDGTDAGDKIRILAWLAYGLRPETVAVRVRGILPDPERLAADGAAVGGAVRLIAECAEDAGQVTACVEPVIVPSESAFGRTIEEQNHVEIDFGWRRPLDLSGPGAGAAPTAAAMLGDILRSCGALPERSPSSSSSPDDHPRSWLVSAALSGSELMARLPANGPDASPVPDDADHGRLVIGPCAWSRLEPYLQDLEQEGLRPHATRVELPGWPAAPLGERTLVASVS